MSRLDERLPLLRKRRIARAYRTLFALPEGSVVLADMMQKCGMLEVSQVTGDPHGTAFNEGRRSVALELLHTLRWSEAQLHDLSQRRAGEQLADTESEL